MDSFVEKKKTEKFSNEKDVTIDQVSGEETEEEEEKEQKENGKITNIDQLESKEVESPFQTNSQEYTLQKHTTYKKVLSIPMGFIFAYLFICLNIYIYLYIYLV